MSFLSHFKRRLFGAPRAEVVEDTLDDAGPHTIEGTLKSLATQDSESFARGETPERRLIPHHAIKRDVIIAAYMKDFGATLRQVDSMGWTDAEKKGRIAEMKADFEKHIYGVKGLDWAELDKLLALMKETRTDLAEIERYVRAQNPIYKIVEPL